MIFDGKIVLITGASSGIGADAAKQMAKLGAKVSIIGRKEHRLNEVAEAIKTFGSPTPLVIVADVTKDAERIVHETIKHFGKLDVLVNNAGVGLSDCIDQVNLSEFDRVFDTNVRSVIKLTNLCVPHLANTKGNVVNISSVAAIKSHSNMMTYSMTKAALDQFTKCCALDLAPMGIRVNSINPSAVCTNIYESFGITLDQFNELLKVHEDMYPIGRVGEVSDTSAAIAFLADNNLTSFLTGIILPVDGGFSVV